MLYLWAYTRKSVGKYSPLTHIKRKDAHRETFPLFYGCCNSNLFSFGKTIPASPQTVEQEAAAALPLTIEDLEKMDPQELAALCKKEGIDVKDFHELLMDGSKMPAFLQTAPQPGKASFKQLLEKRRAKISSK